MKTIPGLIFALLLFIVAGFLAQWVGTAGTGLPQSPFSPIMVAILLGILVRNVFGLSPVFEPGVTFGLVRVLRLGIVLLGIRLSLAEAGEIGLKALPVIITCVTVALLAVTWLSRRLGLEGPLGTLIAAGTGICGATAIVALSPTINARDEETAYAVACIALFGSMSMLIYPFAAHGLFAGDAVKAGLFLGTAVHDTSQVAGAGLVYLQQYGDGAALNVAVVTKLVRNLGMLVVIPLLGVLYHRRAGKTTGSGASGSSGMWSMAPLFIVGFALMSLVRTVGDLGDRPFGFLDPASWQSLVGFLQEAAQYCLGIAMAAVGLGTRLANLKSTGFKPLGVGLFSTLLVGGVSYLMIAFLY